MHRTNWDDLRFVLAVAESGSVSGAARDLGVNHATVLRRIAAFEEAQGTAVFDRTTQGYVILPDKLRVIDAARRAAIAMEQVDHLLQGASDASVARIKVTSTDTMCQAVLPLALSKLSPAFGRVDLFCTNTHMDMSRLAADVTVRPAVELPKDLTGDIAGHLGFGVFARKGARPENWLRLNGALGRSIAADWMADTIDPSQIMGGADSFMVLRELAVRSDQRTILPCCLGDADERLARLDISLPIPSVPVWVASHKDLSDVPQLKAFRAELVAALDGSQDVLLGSAA